MNTATAQAELAMPCHENAVRVGRDEAAIADRRGESNYIIFATDHAEFEILVASKSEIRRREADASESRRGRSVNASGEIDHAVTAKLCGSNADMVRIAEAAIASSRGQTTTPKVAIAQAKFARSHSG